MPFDLDFWCCQAHYVLLQHRQTGACPRAARPAEACLGEAPDVR